MKRLEDEMVHKEANSMTSIIWDTLKRDYIDWYIAAIIQYDMIQYLY